MNTWQGIYLSDKNQWIHEQYSERFENLVKTSKMSFLGQTHYTPLSFSGTPLGLSSATLSGLQRTNSDWRCRDSFPPRGVPFRPSPQRHSYPRGSHQSGEEVCHSPSPCWIKHLKHSILMVNTQVKCRQEGKDRPLSLTWVQQHQLLLHWSTFWPQLIQISMLPLYCQDKQCDHVSSRTESYMWPLEWLQVFLRFNLVTYKAFLPPDQDPNLTSILSIYMYIFWPSFTKLEL